MLDERQPTRAPRPFASMNLRDPRSKTRRAACSRAGSSPRTQVDADGIVQTAKLRTIWPSNCGGGPRATCPCKMLAICASFHDLHDVQPATAVCALGNVHAEDPREQPRPRVTARPRRLRRATLVFVEQPQLLVDLDLGAGHDLGAALGVAGEDSVIADPMAVLLTGAPGRALSVRGSAHRAGR